MACSECARGSRREVLRSFWRQVSNEDKRQLATGSVALVGATAGWGVMGLMGGLVGMFLGGCVGGIVGLTRYQSTAGRMAETKQLTRGELPQ